MEKAVSITYSECAFVDLLILPWKSRKYYIFWVCVCSLTYPAAEKP